MPHTHTHMSALEAQQTRKHKTAAAPVHSLFAATADPPPDWDASLQVWSATISTHKVSDGEVAVLSSYVKAHIMTDKGSGQEKLHCGHRHLMIVMAVPKIQCVRRKVSGLRPMANGRMRTGEWWRKGQTLTIFFESGREWQRMQPFTRINAESV